MSQQERVNYSADMICGGVWDSEQQRFVSVMPQKPFYDETLGFSIIEYADTNGATRASLLVIEPGKSSPCWLIKPDADGGYVEYEKWVAGAGTFTSWSDDGLRSEVRLPESQVSMNSGATKVQPGDMFRVETSQDGRHNVRFDGREVGAIVLSVFPGIPFENEFEERVTPPDSGMV